MESTGPGGIQASDGSKLSASMRRMRWAVLATGLAGSVLLVAFQLEFIPSLVATMGTIGAVVVYAGAAFIAVAGLGSWWLWTRLANTRTHRVSPTSQGILVEFSDGSKTELRWGGVGLAIRIREFSNSATVSGATLLWGKGRMGQYAHITLAGAQQVKSLAAEAGLRLTNTPIGKSTSGWSETRIDRE